MTAYSVLEDDVFLGPGVFTYNDNTMARHDPDYAIVGPTIRRAARVGGGVRILPGIEIGEEAFVATGAVVTRDVPRARARDGRARPQGRRGGRRGADRAVELIRRRRGGFAAIERKTIALGVAAYAVTAAALLAEFGRVWRRGSAPLPRETDSVLDAAAEAAGETVAVAVSGYRETPRRENALFNLLGSFVAVLLAGARDHATCCGAAARVGPFRNLQIGQRHIHHFVPGILLAFGAGAAAILTDNEEIEPRLALVFGTGMGLTLDESALLLELDDVYWSREGVLSVQITLAAMALISASVLGLRFLRRGEAGRARRARRRERLSAEPGAAGRLGPSRRRPPPLAAPYAGWWSRVGAALFDLLVISVPAVVLARRPLRRSGRRVQRRRRLRRRHPDHRADRVRRACCSRRSSSTRRS